MFFYAPTIFEQSGIGTDASFSQAIWVGIVNVIFTLGAMSLIDKIGRKPLMIIGCMGVALSMSIAGMGFYQATYKITQEQLSELPSEIPIGQLSGMVNQVYDSDVQFKNDLKGNLGAQLASKYQSELISSAINMNPMMILIGILGFVASFAISLGPVMWVLFSELFPNRIRGMAISFVGFVNSGVSFLVQFLFPYELSTIGSATTFFIFGGLALVGLLLLAWKMPETKGRSLEELEKDLVTV